MISHIPPIGPLKEIELRRGRGKRGVGRVRFIR